MIEIQNNNNFNKQQIIQQHTPLNKLKIISWISIFIECLLIVVYCILSPSLFSCICLVFVLVQIYFLIYQPKWIKIPFENQIKNIYSFKEDRFVCTYRFQRILWAIFIVINIFIFVYKLTMLLTEQYRSYSIFEQQFLQINDTIHMFLPLLLLPFAAGSMLLPRTEYPLKNYKKRISRQLKYFGFFILGLFLILLQMSSFSYFGIVMLCCILALLSQKQLSYTHLMSKLNILIIGLLTMFLILISHLMRTNYLQEISNIQDQNQFKLYGINCFLNLQQDYHSWLYAINLILTYLWCCLLYRIIDYIRLHHFCLKNKIQQPSQDQFTPQQQDKAKKNNVRIMSLRQYQLPHYSSPSLDEDSDRSNYQLRKRVHTHLQEPLFNYNHRDGKISEKLSNNSQNISPILKAKIISKIIKTSYTFLNIISSPEFALRISELLSIIVIQRYNNIYSFIALLWLALLASVERIKIIYYLTLGVLLPVQIGSYLIIYIYNLPTNPIGSFQHLKIYGFQKIQRKWLDVIIFNMYFIFIFLFIKFTSNSKLNLKQNQNNKSDKPKSSVWVRIIAIIFRYSYLLTIIIMFLVGISKVNLINMIFIILFLVFFAQGEHAVLQHHLKDGRRMATVTTFARKYWIIIVYYTLISIVIRYVYFLFFQNTLKKQLQPTGVNYEHQISVNFSLQNFCSSYTTQLFFIFILAQIQIIIYRSSIYLHYSLHSIDSSVTKTDSNLLTRIIQLLMRFYYQSIYYISGIVIIICCFYWNFFSLVMLIVTCFNLIYGFTQLRCNIVVFLDLVFIFTNYIGLFLQYQIVKDILTHSIHEKILHVCWFIGFDINQDKTTTNLWDLFRLNIVIFYFSVQCYLITKKLKSSNYRQSVQEDEKNNNNHDQLAQQIPRIQEQQQQYERQLPLDISLDQDEFTNYFQKGIKQVQDYYNCNLIQTYPLFRYFCAIFITLINYIITITVIICCLYFRVAVTMLIFLLIYLVYYLSLFQSIGDIFAKNEYLQKFNAQLQNFKNQQNIITNKQQPQLILKNDQNNEQIKQFFKNIHLKIIDLKSSWRIRIWQISSIWSIICISLAYCAQFLNSNFYTRLVCDLNTTIEIQKILFVLGFSIEKEHLFEQIYFYYLMIILNIIQKLLNNYITFMHKNREKQTILSIQSSNKMKNIIGSSNINQLIGQFNKQQFVQQIIIEQKMTLLQDLKQPINIIQPHQYTKQTILNTNLLIYFNYKQSMMKIYMIDGFMTLMIRLYLWILLINVYDDQTIFKFFYFLALLFFWFRRVQFTMVKNINKISIIILAFQYTIMLLTLDSANSPIRTPQNQSLNLLQYLIKDQKWKQFFIAQRESVTTGQFLQAFLINSVVIFVTQIYFTLYEYITKIDMDIINSFYARYKYIAQNIQTMNIEETIYLNLKQYKSFSYRIMNLIYGITITNSYVFVCMLIFFLMWSTQNWPTVALVCSSFFFLFFIIFTSIGRTTKVYFYTKVNFNAIKIIFFLAIFVNLIVSIPFSERTSQIKRYAEIYGCVISLQRIFLLLFIQLWLDLAGSKQFAQTTELHYKTIEKKQKVMLKCLAYHQNNLQISQLIKNYKQIIKFDVNLEQARKIIQEWHQVVNKVSTSAKQSIYRNTSVQLQIGQQSENIKLLHEQIKQQIRLQNESQQSVQIKKSICEILVRNSDAPITHKYYQLFKLIIICNDQLLKQQQSSINIWQFITEDWNKLSNIISNAQLQIKKSFEVINQAQKQYKASILKQYILKNYNIPKSKKQKQSMLQIKAPQKIFINIKQPQKSLSQIIVEFILSNFRFALFFSVWIYYLINPCIFSIPFIIYLFSYDVISNRKLTIVVLLYIFIITLTIKIIFLSSLQQKEWVSYFFYQNSSQESSYNFVHPYLFFLFVIIFIDDEIDKYCGMKFEHPHQVQNLCQSVVRILSNKNQNSDYNLWKYDENISAIEHQQYSQKIKSNPMTIFMNQIENDSNKLLNNQPPGFMEIFRSNKPGVDLYPSIALIQIILVLMLFLYNYLLNEESQNIQQSLKYSSFNSSMVIAILVHVIHMVIERKITLMQNENGKKQLFKYCYTMIILGLFCWFIFYIAPYNLQSYKPTIVLRLYSIIYFFYFFLSGLQIKFGYKKYKSLNSLMTKRNTMNGLFMAIFLAIPFLFELKMLMDWSFTQTSLNIFQWFQLFGIYLSAFKAKLAYYGAVAMELGSPLAYSTKIIGWVGFILIFVFILGPIVLFSDINPASESNLIESGSIEMGVQIVNGNYYRLYSASHFQSPPRSITPQQYDNYGFSSIKQFKRISKNDLSSRFQYIRFKSYSDYYWSLTQPNYQAIKQSINDTIHGTAFYQYQFLVKYNFLRNISSTISVTNSFTYPNQKQVLNDSQLKSLYNSMTNCSNNIIIQNFYISLIRLDTIDNSYKPRPIIVSKGDGNKYSQKVAIQKHCQENNNDTSSMYWSLKSTSQYSPSQTNQGPIMYVLCDKYQNLFTGLNLTTVYTSIVLVVASIIRSVFQSNTADIIYSQNPKPDSIIQLSETISTLRTRKNYKQQYLMFYELIDIIRSPEIMKYISGSYPNLIKRSCQQRKMKQTQQKYEEARKNQ